MNELIFFLLWGIVGLVTYIVYVLLSIKVFPYKREVSMLEQTVVTLISGPFIWIVILVFWTIMLGGIIERRFSTKKFK